MVRRLRRCRRAFSGPSECYQPTAETNGSTLETVTLIRWTDVRLGELHARSHCLGGASSFAVFEQPRRQQSTADPAAGASDAWVFITCSRAAFPVRVPGDRIALPSETAPAVGRRVPAGDGQAGSLSGTRLLVAPSPLEKATAAKLVSTRIRTHCAAECSR